MTPVTDADLEAYLAFNKLPSVLAEAVRAGEWDRLTGMQVLARHREAAEQRGRLEGAEIMREVAAKAMEGLGFFTDVEELLHMTKMEMSERTCHEGASAIRHLDPAAILDQHTRAKAMDELIAGDADLI
jgi:hypothetical protein